MSFTCFGESLAALKRFNPRMADARHSNRRMPGYYLIPKQIFCFWHCWGWDSKVRCHEVSLLYLCLIEKCVELTQGTNEGPPWLRKVSVVYREDNAVAIYLNVPQTSSFEYTMGLVSRDKICILCETKSKKESRWRKNLISFQEIRILFIVVCNTMNSFLIGIISLSLSE